MSMNVYYNPLDSACKNVCGGVKVGELLQLNVFLLKDGTPKTTFTPQTREFYVKTPTVEECTTPTENAFLRLNFDGEAPELFPMQKTDFGWTVSLRFEQTGLYFYSFLIENHGNISCGFQEMGVLSEQENGFLLTVSSADYHTPNWFKGGVMYQIFPDRFCKQGVMPDIKGRVERKDWGGIPSYRPNEKGKVINNDIFGGNFKGIQSKLPYLRRLALLLFISIPYSKRRQITATIHPII